MSPTRGGSRGRTLPRYRRLLQSVCAFLLQNDTSRLEWPKRHASKARQCLRRLARRLGCRILPTGLATMALPLQRDPQEPVGDGIPERRFLGPSCLDRSAGPAPRTQSGRICGSRCSALAEPYRSRSASSLESWFVCEASGRFTRVQRFAVSHTVAVGGLFGGRSSRGRQALPFELYSQSPR